MKMFRHRRPFVLIAFVLTFLVVVVAAFVLSNAHAQGTQSPDRVAVMPGMARTGQALMVSFWGAEPHSLVTVKIQDADSWVCRDAGVCDMEPLPMPTYLVQADGNGHGYFAVGVPCGYPPGLLHMDVGGLQISVPVTESSWCKGSADWIAGMR